METEHHGKLGQNKRGQRLTKLSIKPRRKQMNQGNDKPCDCYVGLKSSTPKNPRFPLILELEQFRNNLRCVLLILTTNFTGATLPSKPQLIDEYLGTAGVVSVEISSSAHCCLQRPFRAVVAFSARKFPSRLTRCQLLARRKGLEEHQHCRGLSFRNTQVKSKRCAEELFHVFVM